MLRTMLSHFTLPLLLLFGITSGNSQSPETNADGQSGNLEKMIIANGNVAMDLDLNQLNGSSAGTKDSKRETLRFEAGPNSFFTILVFNNQLRGPEPGSMGLIRKNSVTLPGALNASSNQLVVEKIESSEPFDLVVRDGKTGFRFFNIEGHQYDYDAAAHLLRIKDGRLLISEEFAKTLGRPGDAGTTVGKISIAATMYPIEIDKVVNGVVKSAVLPAMRPATSGGTEAPQPSAGSVPGPDVIVGDLQNLAQGGSSGNYVGLGVGTTSCNQGVVDLDWFALSNTDHPVIPQNLYRMSGGATNTDRFEQIGQSWLKHAFTALTGNVCNLGCNGVGGSHLGSGCSDPYDASLNYGQSGLGSRAWVNPFTGSFPSTAASHTGHTHTGTSHRVLVAMSDLDTTQNSGATYFAEGQYVTPHEYVWCQAHPGQCNMYNNVSYRRFSVTGTTSFTFSPVGSTQRTMPAINAWTGATINQFEPEPGVDGIGFVGYKVTNPSAGVWHYEYAVYNENLDRAIQSFSVPLGCGITASNLGFHSPPQEPGWANDGTFNNAGYSAFPWAANITATDLTWSSETFAQNQNANAIRWGTLYNFRFDSNRPPQIVNATLGFFKTGAPITVAIQGPTPDTCNPLQITSAFSRMTQGGAGDFAIDLPLTGEPGVECRSGGGNYTIVVTFSNTMVSGDASVTSGTGNVAGSPAFNGNTMTVNLTGVADVQQITVTLSNVTDAFAQVLPDTLVSMNVLIGDTNGNKSVNAGDLAQTKGQSGVPVTSANFREDVNASGNVSAGDTAMVKANAGHTLP